MRARLAVRISPADVGSRITVRTRYHGPEASVTDVVGVLRAWDDGVLTIERRDGTMRSVVQGDLVAGRVVPTAPVRARKPRSDRPNRPNP
ncbi:MAG TPA: hypothetical protein VK923_20670 [Euzebyales bacterium]|nr:hypothetical protein [Euzebyales bacterium]